MSRLFENIHIYIQIRRDSNLEIQTEFPHFTQFCNYPRVILGNSLQNEDMYYFKRGINNLSSSLFLKRFLFCNSAEYFHSSFFFMFRWNNNILFTNLSSTQFYVNFSNNNWTCTRQSVNTEPSTFFMISLVRVSRGLLHFWSSWMDSLSHLNCLQQNFS